MRYGTKINCDQGKVMELYFSPLACSMATRIALYEADVNARFHEVDARTRRTRDGEDFRTVNPLGQVPVLRTDTGEVLTENQAILQYVADCYPKAGLAPAGGMSRYRLQQWLSFIGTELHKAVFTPLLTQGSPEGAKAFARQKAPARLGLLESHLDGREYLLDRFSVADAYLTTVLGNWSKPAGIALAEWPVLAAYVHRMHARPSIAKAFGEEMTLYQAEQARQTAAE